MKDGNLWQAETGIYLPRLASALAAIEKIGAQFEDLPSAPFDFQPTKEQQLAFSLMIFARGGTITIGQLLDNVYLLWTEGRMIGINGLVRFSVEYWAAIHFGYNIILKYQDDMDLDEAIRICQRLTMSGKTPVKLPWGGETQEESYSVMKFINELSQDSDSISNVYAFLCEGSHPNALQNTYFSMAGSLYDNYSNDKFKKHAHELLEQTTGAVEIVARGMSEDIPDMINVGLSIFRGS